jgi:low affinity Fe/Cu permease
MRVRPSRELYFLARLLTRREAIYGLMIGFVACAIAALYGHAEAVSIFVLVLITAVAIVTLVQNDGRNTAVLAKLDLLLREARGVSSANAKDGRDKWTGGGA